METNIRHLIDFEKVDTLLEGFNKSTGFVTAILDLEGNVLSKSGWRQMCTDFHRINPETSKKCTISDTELANKMGEGEKYHFYKCLNGLVDVAVPIIIKGEHVANLFSGQFFFEEPDSTFFKKQAEKYGFDEGKYLAALNNVPVVSQEKVKTAMDFLLNMTHLISDLASQKTEQFELNKQLIAAKEKAVASEENLSTTLQSIGDAVISTDDNGLVVSMNPVAETLCGWQLADALGKPLSEVFTIVNAETRQNVADPVKKVFEKGEIVGLANHTILVSRDGTEYHIADSAAPIKNKEGAITGVVLVFSDITGSYIAQKQIKDSEEKFSKSFFNSPDSITINRFDDGKIVTVNNGFRKIMGYEEAEVIDKTTTELNFYKNPEERNAIINALKTTGQALDIECWFITKHGEEILGLLSAAIIDIEGVKHIISTSRDITERKKTERLLQEKTEEIEAQNEEYQQLNEELIQTNQELQKAKEKTEESEKRFRKSIEFSPVPIAVADNNGDLLFLNKQYVDTFGYSIEELGSIPKWFELAYPDIEYRNSCLTQWSSDVEFAIKNSVPTPVREGFITCKNGVVKTVEISVSIENDIFIGLFQNITERKQAEAKLQREQALYMDLVNALPAGMYRLNVKPVVKWSADNWRSQVGSQYVVDFVSDRFCEITGIDRQEFIANPGLVPDRIHPDDSLEFTHKNAAAILSLSTFSWEGRMIVPDKGTTWIRFESIPRALENGEVIWTGIVNDISERKQAEEALRESEEKFSKAFQTSPYAITITRAEDGGFIEVNDAFTLITGYTREEALTYSSVGLKLWANEEDRESVIADLRAGRAVEGREYQFRTKSGKNITCLFSAQIMRLSDGPCILSSINDITERKNAEESLKISRERLLLATEGANLGIWNWNTVTGELIWSNQCKALFGIGLNETMSYQRFSDALHPDDRERSDLAVKDALDNHKDYDIDYRSVWPDGSIHWLAAKGRGYYDAMGKAVHMEGIVLDITQRKHAEEEIKKQLDELQRWHQVTLGREGRILELKKEVNDLLHQRGEALRYGSTIPENTAGETKV